MISVIIPAYNEEDQIEHTIRWVRNHAASGDLTEIIVVDGGSRDKTLEKAAASGALAVISPQKGRGAQMNYGASIAKGKLLYFLHADSIPPEGFTSDILSAVGKGYTCGCYRLRFDINHWFLRANCWFTRFNVNAVRFGDQSLFVLQDTFRQSGGFRVDLIVMEDQEIIHRLKKQGRFIVMQAAVTTSARKYLDNGIYRMQAIFFRVWLMYYLGFSQQQILNAYRRLVQRSKL